MARLTSDLAAIISRVVNAVPDAEWAQLKVTHPADDDGIWFFRRASIDVQIESSSGECPFVIECNVNDERVVATTVDDVVRTVVALLRNESA